MKISEIKGIGDKTEKLLNKLGIFTIDDLVHYYPKNYETFEPPIHISQIDNENIVAIKAQIVNRLQIKNINNLQLLTTNIVDSNGDSIKTTWFNMPYLKNKLKVGSHYIFRGRICRKYGLVLEQPGIYTEEEYETKKMLIQPRYGLTSGLKNSLIIKAVSQILNAINEKDILPEFIKKEYDLADYSFAINHIHFPKNYESLLYARKRLAFEEFFIFICTLRNFKEIKVVAENDFIINPSPVTMNLINRLPYTLTNAQVKTLNEVQSDLYDKKVMSRLIQGDVGSGKTIIAICCLIDVVMSGYQGAFMVPTEVLASQHYDTITKMFKEYNIPIKTVLLTGSMTAGKKKEINKLIECGEAGIIIGTHALIQENVQYCNLALVITDEQHRFGVKQREMLSKKGKEPNILVMSATPIPRTLALILYGDLDISVMDEFPANRLPIKNCVVLQDYRSNAYRFIQKEVEKGRQAYIICPMVEESETIEAENVTDYSNSIKEVLNNEIIVECLHGRMKPSIKNEIMQRFLNKEIHVLVSTTVIEVGVNVPNATVIMIENAERFGLAALHQLRGRVGRGNEQSYCIFVSGSSKQETLDKLEILNNSNDGFKIAAEDLKTRGPGDIFGIRQSGELRFKVGDIYQDANLIKQASEAVDLYYKNRGLLTADEIDFLERKCQLTKELLML